MSSMEMFGFVREIIWKNAGFGSLRSIAAQIREYEPWFEPQVVPLADDSEDEDLGGKDDDAEPVDERADPVHKAVYPDARYYSVVDYHDLFLSGALTPLDVVEVLLPLIRRDVPQPTEHSKAWFETNVEKVLAAARASTQRYKEGRCLGVLDGVPTGVKDEYDIDGYRTCLGSRNTYVSSADQVETSWCVRQLQEAGAILLGKCSMHEFGLDTTGNNPIYGTPRNPHNPNYYTGGSSSGTGYAVAAGLIPVGLGSDGGGSIRIPSSMCGVFGLKPTHGRLSFHPGQNHSITCACLGPIAADPDSLAAVFSVISTPHHTSPFPPPRPLRLASPSDPSTKPLGIPTDWYDRATPAIQALCNTTIQRLVSDHNYHIVPITIPFLPEGQIAHAMTVLTDAATLLPETRNLTAANRILISIGRTTPSTDYLLAQKLRRVLMQHLSWLWREHPGLLVITPTTACEGWPIRGGASELRYGVSDGDHTVASMEYVWLANFCGLPSITVPAGFVPAEAKLRPAASSTTTTKSQDAEPHRGDVPIGLLATGEWCSEEQLLQFAADVGVAQRRRPPVWVDVVQEAKKVQRPEA